MAVTVTMPQLGETVTEGTILSWAKGVGDSIAEDEVLLEISTDKVDTEVPSPAGGTVLELLVPEGETVDVGTELCVIGEVGEAVSSAPAAEAPEAAPVATVPEPAPAPEPGPADPFEAESQPVPAAPAAAAPAPAAPPTPAVAAVGNLSPVVRRLAAEHGVDVSQVAGTGAGGRITRRDIEAYIAAGPGAVPAGAPERAALGRTIEDLVPEPVGDGHALFTPTAPSAPSAPAPAAPPPTPAPAMGDRVEDLDRLRVRIAENMVRAKQTAAHVWTSVEVDYENVERARRRHREAFKAREGFSLTYLPFISRATIDALKAFPVVNSSFNLEEKTATYHKRVDLGIAVDLNQGGLVVARVRNADGLRLVGIAREIRSLAEGARAGKLGIDDLSGSTFTITNPGPFGSFMSAPIINVPNVAILSTDTVTKRATVVTTPDGQDTIAIRHIGYLGLSWDHRAFDGSTAVLFLRRIKENIETWDWEQELA